MILIFAYLTCQVMKLQESLKRPEKMSSDGRSATESHCLLSAVAEIVRNALRAIIRFATSNSSRGSRIGVLLQNMLPLIMQMSIWCSCRMKLTLLRQRVWAAVL